MSTEQPALTDFVAEQEPQDTAEREPAVVDTTPAYGQPEQECLECGSDVPDGIARVMGDNDGCVPACPGCLDGISQWFVAIQRGRGNGYDKGRSQ